MDLGGDTAWMCGFVILQKGKDAAATFQYGIMLI